MIHVEDLLREAVSGVGFIPSQGLETNLNIVKEASNLTGVFRSFPSEAVLERESIN